MGRLAPLAALALAALALPIAPAGAVEAGLPPTPALGSSGMLLAYIPDPEVWRKLASIPLLAAGPARPEPAYRGGLGGWEPGDAVILVGSGELVGAARRIAELYRSVGVRPIVVTVDSVVSSYPEAEPPPYSLDEEDLARCCGASYNMSVALRVVSFLRSAVEAGARYLLILGDDSAVPPFYYFSHILSYVASVEQAVVATDYWYADPDYDFEVEVAVGRVPASTAEEAERFVESLELWYWLVRGGGLRALAAGGAPFFYPFMVGETSVIQVSAALPRVFDEVDYMTVSLGNYAPAPMAARLRGYQLAYVVAHGLGSKLVDAVPRGLWGAEFSYLLSADEVEGLGPMIFVTPACMSAQWDYRTIRPPFDPPSLGVAMVLSGASVAYLGSTRLAIEVVTGLTGTPAGGLEVSYAGMVRLTETVLLKMPLSRSVGEAVVRALNEYSRLLGAYLAVTPGGVEDVALLTMLEFVLLGDPVAPLPEPRGAYAEPLDLELPEPRVEVPVDLVIQAFSSIASGDLAGYGPGRLVVNVTPCPDEVRVWGLRRLYGYVLADLVEVEHRVRGWGGGCSVEIEVAAPLPSLLEVVAVAGGRMARAMFVVAGAQPVDGGVLLTGLDLLRTVGDEPVVVTVDGRPYTVVPGAVEGAVVRVPGGDVGVVPWRLYAGLTVGEEMRVRLLELVDELFSVSVEGPARLELVPFYSGGRTYVAVLRGGEPVAAELTVVPYAEGVGVEAVEVSPGLYELRAYSASPVLANVTAVVGGEAASRVVVVAPSAPARPDRIELAGLAGLLGLAALLASRLRAAPP